jgi:hypothetical protein
VRSTRNTGRPFPDGGLAYLAPGRREPVVERDDERAADALVMLAMRAGSRARICSTVR